MKTMVVNSTLLFDSGITFLAGEWRKRGKVFFRINPGKCHVLTSNTPGKRTRKKDETERVMSMKKLGFIIYRNFAIRTLNEM